MLAPIGLLHLSRACAKEKKGSFDTDCIRIERDRDGRCVAVATDGKMLLVARWGEIERDTSDCALLKKLCEDSKMVEAGCCYPRSLFTSLWHVWNGHLDRAKIDIFGVCESTPSASIVYRGIASRVAMLEEADTKFPNWRRTAAGCDAAIGERGRVLLSVSPVALSKMAGIASLACGLHGSADYETTVASGKIDAGPVLRLTVKTKGDAAIELSGYLMGLQ